MEKQSMQALQVQRPGGPEQLRMTRLPRPEPQEGEVLVRVHAAGLRPVDWQMLQGLVRVASFPYTPGGAFAGVIEEEGSPGLAGLQKGRAVFGRSSGGAFAEYAVARPEHLALKPEALSFAEAAAIAGGAIVAWLVIMENDAVQAGRRVLIHRGTAGFNTFAIQFAAHKGADVFCTVSPAHADLVRLLGAVAVIDDPAMPMAQVASDMDLTVDTLGSEELWRSMQTVKPGGTFISLFDRPPREESQARGIRAIKHTSRLPDRQLLETIATFILDEQIKIVLEKPFSLERIQYAYTLFHTGEAGGSMVLEIVH